MFQLLTFPRPAATGPGKFGSKGAEEFNVDFNAKLTNAYIGKIAYKTGVERLVKQTVSKRFPLTVHIASLRYLHGWAKCDDAAKHLFSRTT